MRRALKSNETNVIIFNVIMLRTPIFPRIMKKKSRKALILPPGALLKTKVETRAFVFTRFATHFNDYKKGNNKNTYKAKFTLKI